MMFTKNKSIKSNKSRSLSATLATAFVVLSVISLVVVSNLLIYLNFKTEQKVIDTQQQLIATGAANEVSSFIEQMFSVLDTAARVGHNSATVTDEGPRLLVDKLLGSQMAFREVALLDSQGQLLALSSRRSLTGSSDSINYADPDILTQTRQGQHYVSSVYIDEVTVEPLVLLAVPVMDTLNEFRGVIVAEVNLKFMWDLVGELEVGQEGVAYVVDRQGNLIAFGDRSRVLRGENLGHLKEVAEFIERADALVELKETNLPISTGINGTSVLASYIPLGRPDWAVVVEIPVREAYQAILVNLGLSMGILIVVASIAGIAGVYASRRLAAPLLNLTQSATRIAEGELNLVVAVDGPIEVIRLADAFNSMTAQLRESITSLEQRVIERTQRLKMVATLGERLNAILDFNQLLVELVDQVKESLDCYHAHVYIIDETRQNLVMRVGAGEAGAKMKAVGHTIALDASTSLVARAARTGEIVIVDDVRQTDDWLANPLLPDTYAEMAVPIIVEKQVVGVLDVQEDRVGGLDEGDADLLRSLANQVAVAMTNARLFEQTVQTKNEAERAQREAEQTQQEAERAKEEAERAKEQAQAANKILEQQIWQTAGLAQLNEVMRGEQDIPSLANNIIQHVCRYLRVQIGALYVVEGQYLKREGRFAHNGKNQPQQFKFGEGLVGQTALEKRPVLVSDVPDDYITMRSGLGEQPPTNILLFPFVYNDQVVGVIELGALSEFNQAQMEFIETALTSIAITFNTTLVRTRINELLAQTRPQVEDLQVSES